MEIRVHFAGLRFGNVQVFFPEGNVLFPGGRRDRSGVPDFNTEVEILPLSTVSIRRNPARQDA